MREMTGGCLCGQVRYSANADPAIVAVCHCKILSEADWDRFLSSGWRAKISDFSSRQP